MCIYIYIYIYIHIFLFFSPPKRPQPSGSALRGRSERTSEQNARKRTPRERSARQTTYRPPSQENDESSYTKPFGIVMIHRRTEFPSSAF